MALQSSTPHQTLTYLPSPIIRLNTIIPMGSGTVWRVFVIMSSGMEIWIPGITLTCRLAAPLARCYTLPPSVNTAQLNVWSCSLLLGGYCQLCLQYIQLPEQKNWTTYIYIAHQNLALPLSNKRFRLVKCTV